MLRVRTAKQIQDVLPKAGTRLDPLGYDAGVLDSCDEVPHRRFDDGGKRQAQWVNDSRWSVYKEMTERKPEPDAVMEQRAVSPGPSSGFLADRMT